VRSLYDFPELYDLILERPAEVVETEVRSILGLLAKHGIAEAKILELACGACAHGIPLARAGSQVVGIDRSPAMLAQAQRRAAAASVQVHTIQGDVVDFDLGVSDFDAALFLFETFPLITEYGDIASHFEAVRRHMRRGGLYIVDVDAGRHGVRTEKGEWGRRTVPLPDGYVETWNEDLPGDWVQGTNHMVLHCRIHLGDEVYETRDDWHIRVYSPWELALLARALAGWELDGFYSWQDLCTNISDQEHYFAVFVAG
jgi:SAM-dependent methyltransferase